MNVVMPAMEVLCYVDMPTIVHIMMMQWRIDTLYYNINNPTCVGQLALATQVG